jgi:NAD(P)H-dependent FMN reductase
MHIVILPGTNRSGSLTRALAGTVARLHNENGATTDILDLAELPAEALLGSIYKQPTAAVVSFVKRLLAADGVHALVPEYNGSLPGVMKLFIDLLPYPGGFQDRPMAYVGVSAGRFGGVRAVEHLQQISGYRNAHGLPSRLFIAEAHKAIAADGSLLDAELSKRLTAQVAAFQAFVKTLGATPAKG